MVCTTYKNGYFPGAHGIVLTTLMTLISGWWFGTFFIFP
jgi:hypothetical protein